MTNNCEHYFNLSKELNQFDVLLYDKETNLLLECIKCNKEYVGVFQLNRFYENTEENQDLEEDDY